MPQVNIPDGLYEEIQKALCGEASPSDFIVQAVRDKLSFEGQKREFYQLTVSVRAGMIEQGLSEEDMLADFEMSRREREG